MSAIDLLMNVELKEITRKKGSIKLLLQRIDKEVEFECVELSTDMYSKIEALAMDSFKDNTKGLLDYRINIIMSGCKLFSDKNLQEHFSVPTPKELILKLLNYEEITLISDYILSLTSSSVITSDDIKN